MAEKGTYEREVTCCGVRVAADEAEVQRVMTLRGLSADEQAREWLRLQRRYADPAWMELCVQNARRMAQIVSAEREVLAIVGGSDGLALSATPRSVPSDALAQRHFEWLGDRRKVPVPVVRDGIEALARCGFISTDADQQAALRRGLGIAVNDAERHSRAPWVRWLGEADALNYLVDSLWQLDLIHCTGGRRYKWQTLCGVFLRGDGTCFEPSIKSNRCTNARKRTVIDEAMLNGLRFVSATA